MIGRGGTLSCRRHGPVHGERAAPDSKVENFHNDEADSNVVEQYLDRKSFFASDCHKTLVEEEKAELLTPSGHDLGLFHDEHQFRAIFSVVNLFRGERTDIEARR